MSNSMIVGRNCCLV